mgnify:CR=1 FL=1
MLKSKDEAKRLEALNIAIAFSRALARRDCASPEMQVTTSRVASDVAPAAVITQPSETETSPAPMPEPT